MSDLATCFVWRVWYVTASYTIEKTVGVFICRSLFLFCVLTAGLNEEAGARHKEDGEDKCTNQRSFSEVLRNIPRKGYVPLVQLDEKRILAKYLITIKSTRVSYE